MESNERSEGAEKLGVKSDKEKLQYRLLPSKAVREIVHVLTLGASKKYAPFNWLHVPNARERYYDAAMRHLELWKTGEQRDPEWNLHHLAHAGCCILFILGIELRDPEAVFPPVDPT